MVDRAARDEIALVLRRFTSGRLSGNEAYQRVQTIGKGTEDRAVQKAADLLLWADELGDAPVTRYPEWWDMEEVDRRDITRWIVFLHSDREYRYPQHSCDAVAAFLGLPVVLLGIGLLSLNAVWILYGVLGFVVIGYLWRITAAWDYRRQGIEDAALEPFLSAADFGVARRRPRLLAGVPGEG